MDKYQQFDTVVAAIYTELGIKANKDGYISFDDFNLDNTEHLCIFHIAALIAGVYKKPFYINGSLIQYVKCRRKNNYMKKMFHWHKSKKNVNINALVVTLYEKFPELYKLEFGLGDIYHEYYEAEEEE